VLGLVGISIVALVLGIIALRQIGRSQGQQKGKGFAIAGIVIGAIELALQCAVVFFLVYFVATCNGACLGG
jgi:hypothetical protein